VEAEAARAATAEALGRWDLRLNEHKTRIVQEQGAVVRRDVEQVKVTLHDKETRTDKVLATAPVREVEQVVLCGNVQLTTQAAALLLQNEVDVVFLSFYGTFRGRLVKGGSKFAQLRHAQLQLSGDDRRSLAVAVEIVRAKLANQRNLLRRLAEQAAPPVAPRPWPELSAGLLRASQGIDQMRRGCDQARDADSLRGFEGKAGAYYFEALGSLLDKSWSFGGRKYYPAPDAFNALLSFGYALLQKDVAAAIQLVGLDPYLGCFHAMQYDRPSLVLDLMEEFRPLVVDRAVLDLVSGGKVKADDFTFTGNQERPVELGPKLIPLVIGAYEARVTGAVVHAASGEQNTLRRCLELQARIFARVVMGARQGYEGLVA
jgi:CRISPR-associated protein Cas1